MNSVRLFENMQKEGLDFLLLSRIDNVDYLTGTAQPAFFGAYVDNAEYMPHAYALVSLAERKVTLLLSEMCKYLATPAVIADETVLFKQYSYLEYTNAAEEVCKTIVSCLPSSCAKIRIGVEPMSMPAPVYNALSATGAEICDAMPMMRTVRAVKTEREIELIRYSCALEDIAQNKLLDFARDFHNETDLEIWSAVTHEMNKAAGRPLEISGELATGAAAGTSNYPSGPNGRRIEAGDMGRMDISIRPNGYWCDCTNTVVFGKEPNERQKWLFGMIIEAYDTAREFLRPGYNLYDVHKSCLDTYAKYGYTSKVYSGHQIGCGVNEPLRILNYDRMEIEAGMVVCLEPQLYIPGGEPLGVRLEHVILVTENGPEDLNKFQWGCSGK